MKFYEEDDEISDDNSMEIQNQVMMSLFAFMPNLRKKQGSSKNSDDNNENILTIQ